MAKLKKKKKLFQKAYHEENGIIYITDTERSKKRFLKSGIRNVAFGEEFPDEELFSGRLFEAAEYDAKFCLEFAEDMVNEVIEKLKLTLPLREIAVFSDESEKLIKGLSQYTRLISVVGSNGDGAFEKGVPVRYVKKLKNSPDMIICDSVSPKIFDVPTIDLTRYPQRGNKTLAWDRMSFKTDLFNFEINTPALLYFLKKGEIKEFQLTSLRKKCGRIFTFS